MKHRRPDDASLDKLLKRALTDDLPLDVAAGMRERLERFRDRTMESQRRPRVPFFLVRRSAWALVSILMLVSGGLLQGLGVRNPLADRVSTIGAFQAVSRRLAAAPSMSCSVRVAQDGGSCLIYGIEWRSDHGTVVKVKRADGTLLKEFEAEESGLGSDPLLQAVRPFLDPSAVAQLLSGDWRLTLYSREGACETGTYLARSLDGRLVLEFTIDLCVYRPVRISGSESGPPEAGQAGKILWEARFNF